MPSKKPAGGAAGAASMRVPLLDLTRQYAQIREQVLAAIERVCASQHFILGLEVESFEREVAAFTGTAFAVGCASGTDALWLSLMAAGIGPGAVVATTPFSFFASASSIVRAGARPVFVDIDPATLNLDLAQLERAVTTTFARQVKAFIPVHLFGQCCDMDSCQRIAAEHKLAMIEDAAQAFGATWRGRRAGSFAAAAAFSFYPTKNLSAYGDAGCIMTDDAAIAEHVRRLRNHGGHERYYHDEIGWNSRLDALQAAILRVKLNYVTEWNNRRRERAAYYDRLLAESGLGGTGTGISAAQPIARLGVGAQAHHIFHQYVVRAHRRDELREFLGARGVGTEIYYPVPLHLQKCFAYLGYGEGDLPEAERAAREVLALPMFPELTEDEQRYVTQAIAQFYS